MYVKNERIMTTKQKQLLLQDLCARLPYGVKVCVGTQCDIDNDITDIALLQGLEFDNPTFGVKALVCVETYSGSNTFGTDIEDIKPYLRPIESITEEEKDKLRKLLWFGYPSDDYDINAHRGIEIASVLHDTWKNAEFDFEEFNDLQDFLNSIHIDYRGLIPIGLALPAPEGMYND